MAADFLELVESSKALNSKVFSLPRLLLLSALAALGLDGAPYRELKAALQMDDGILYANLKALQEMGYVKLEKTSELNKKELDFFIITTEGKAALQKTVSWLVKLALQTRGDLA